MNKPGIKNIITGVLILAVGGGITLYTYSQAQPGESYTLAYGAIIFGAGSILVGLFQLITSRK